MQHATSRRDRPDSGNSSPHRTVLGEQTCLRKWGSNPPIDRSGRAGGTWTRRSDMRPDDVDRCLGARTVTPVFALAAACVAIASGGRGNSYRSRCRCRHLATGEITRRLEPSHSPSESTSPHRACPVGPVHVGVHHATAHFGGRQPALHWRRRLNLRWTEQAFRPPPGSRPGGSCGEAAALLRPRMTGPKAGEKGEADGKHDANASAEAGEYSGHRPLRDCPPLGVEFPCRPL